MFPVGKGNRLGKRKSAFAAVRKNVEVVGFTAEHCEVDASVMAEVTRDYCVDRFSIAAGKCRQSVGCGSGGRIHFPD